MPTAAVERRRLCFGILRLYGDFLWDGGESRQQTANRTEDVSEHRSLRCCLLHHETECHWLILFSKHMNRRLFFLEN